MVIPPFRTMFRSLGRWSNATATALIVQILLQGVLQQRTERKGARRDGYWRHWGRLFSQPSQRAPL